MAVSAWSEAYDIIADADARSYGMAADLFDFSDPPSRHFRNAWRRSANGGRIVVDEEFPRALQAEYIANAVELWNREMGATADWWHCCLR